MFELRSAVVVVTGASSGLGRRFALDLAGRGAMVTGVARRAELLASLSDELRRASPGSSTVVCDVSDIDAWRAVLAAVRSSTDASTCSSTTPACPSPRRPRRRGRAGRVSRRHGRQLLRRRRRHLGGSARDARATHGVIVNVSSDSGRAPGPRDRRLRGVQGGLERIHRGAVVTAEDGGVHSTSSTRAGCPPPWGQVPSTPGMAMPPRAVRRTEEQVSRLVLAKMGRSQGGHRRHHGGAPGPDGPGVVPFAVPPGHAQGGLKLNPEARHPLGSPPMEHEVGRHERQDGGHHRWEIRASARRPLWPWPGPGHGW